MMDFKTKGAKLAKASPSARTQGVRVWPQGIPALLMMTALVVGESGVVLQLYFNVIKTEGAIMTSFLQTILGTFLLWGVVWTVPRLRQPGLKMGWPQWWRATAIGGSSVVSLVAARSAMTLVPYGTIVCLAFVGGPMAAAGFRIVRAKAWRALCWPALAAASVFLLVDGLGTGDIKGIMLVGLVSVAYHVYATTTSALPKEELNTVATAARLPTVLLLTAMLFLSPEGAGALLHVSGEAWWVTAVSGAVGVVALLLINWAWALQMTVATHAGTRPFDNLLAMIDGMLAGQFPTLANWLGAGLVVVSEVGVTRARIEDRKEPSMFSMVMDDLPNLIVPHLRRILRDLGRVMRVLRRVMRDVVARVGGARVSSRERRPKG